MEFNDTTNYQGLCQDANYFAGLEVTDTTNYTIKDKTRNANAWYRKVNSWIWEATGDWEYDDSNWTNLPIATTDLVDEQQDYELPSNAQRILRVEVKNSDENYELVSPLDQSQVTDEAMSEYLEEPGMPDWYDVVGRSLMLYPKPDSADVTTSNGLKLYFSREIDQFDITDTSTEPGFSENYHRLVSLGMAYDYCLRHGQQDRKKDIRSEIEQMRGQMQTEYGGRHRNFGTRLRPRIEKII